MIYYAPLFYTIRKEHKIQAYDICIKIEKETRTKKQTHLNERALKGQKTNIF